MLLDPKKNPENTANAEFVSQKRSYTAWKWQWLCIKFDIENISFLYKCSIAEQYSTFLLPLER